MDLSEVCVEQQRRCPWCTPQAVLSGRGARRVSWTVCLVAVGFLLASCGSGGSTGGSSLLLTADETTVYSGGLVRLEAHADGVATSDLEWSASAGLVQPAGTSASYRAPSRVGSHAITVRSSVDASLSASVTVTVQERADFAPSEGAEVVEAEPGEYVVIAPAADGGAHFASRNLNAELDLAFESSTGAPVDDPVVVFSERANGASSLLAFDPSGEHGPVLIVGDQSSFAGVLGGGGLDTASLESADFGLSFLVIAGVVTFSSIVWTAVKTEESGQQIETFYETDLVDCEFDTCLCKTPNEIAVLHAARAQQLFAIPRVVLSGLLVGGAADAVEATALVLDVSDLLDNFGVSVNGDVKMNPFSWAEDWVAEAKDQYLLGDVTTDSHLLYVVDSYEDPETGRVMETVSVVEEDCDSGLASMRADEFLTLVGEVIGQGQVSFSVAAPGGGSGVAVYLTFRNTSTDHVIARRVLTDGTGTATFQGDLDFAFGDGFAFGVGSTVSAAIPSLDLVDESALGALIDAPSVIDISGAYDMEITLDDSNSAGSEIGETRSFTATINDLGTSVDYIVEGGVDTGTRSGSTVTFIEEGTSISGDDRYTSVFTLEWLSASRIVGSARTEFDSGSYWDWSFEGIRTSTSGQ